jgi:nucleoside-diphosphate-sugar epimerase
MERTLEKGARSSGIGVTVLRLANVYGSGDSGIVDQLLPQVVHGGRVTLPEKGYVNTVHVDDVVDASRRLAAMAREEGAEGDFRVWNCVDDGALTSRELLDAIARVTGSPVPELRRPGLVGASRGRWAHRKHCVRLVERGRYANDAIKGTLPDWPRWPDVERGLPGEV